eukprot:TRINITY_DN13440_c0_g1_i2.p1 TRINITY_DN13440_c0_g1~~TRINITY_DN13440_c0_g1_i2.p1  ORF type:complete len:218 (-),score=55.35 TRINITY_DN13440_c0_g1_i2:78-731(-)
MKTYILALYVLSITTLCMTDDFCGPQDCGLMCEGGEQCVEEDSVNCCCEPCCARWNCESNIPSQASCPERRPEFNSACEDGEQGLHCDYGDIECCGETYPEISMECVDNTWVGYYIDTLCILGLAPPCPDDTTTTEPAEKSGDETTTAISQCPPVWPDENSACEDGLKCPYGMEECCGEMIPDVIFECNSGQWGMMIIDSLCDFGIPCPEESTTTGV